MSVRPGRLFLSLSVKLCAKEKIICAKEHQPAEQESEPQCVLSPACASLRELQNPHVNTEQGTHQLPADTFVMVCADKN